MYRALASLVTTLLNALRSCGYSQHAAAKMKQLLVNLVVLGAFLVMALFFAAQGVGEERAVWSGAQGQVVDKGSSTQTRSQFNWLILDTQQGTRKVYVDNATMARCGRGDLYTRRPRSYLVTCRGETNIDWGALAYSLAALLCFAVTGLMIWAIISHCRDWADDRKRAGGVR